MDLKNKILIQADRKLLAEIYGAVRDVADKNRMTPELTAGYLTAVVKIIEESENIKAICLNQDEFNSLVANDVH
jgi:hypothetical protein